MTHTHNITDADKHFIIDPVTRTIKNESDKLVIAQGDHNSERYTFEVPRIIENHDMGKSTRIEVHFSNYIRTKKQKNNDVYPVPVIDISSDEDRVYFSWLVSGNATQLVGFLTFSVTFICHDENNNVIYSWSTGIYSSISVLQKHTNTESILTLYPDLYQQLKQDMLNEVSSGTIDNVIDFDTVPPEEEPPIDIPDDNPDDGFDTGADDNTGDDIPKDETDNVVDFDDIVNPPETDNVVEF